MNKAVIYARYSSDSQTEQSIDGQLRVCKEYAEEMVWLLLMNILTGLWHRNEWQTASSSTNALWQQE